MKKVLFILMAIMLFTISCNKEEVVEERGCYEFTIKVTYSPSNIIGYGTLGDPTETEIICSIVESDAIAMMNYINNTSETITSSEGIPVKVTRKATYKRL